MSLSMSYLVRPHRVDGWMEQILPSCRPSHIVFRGGWVAAALQRRRLADSFYCAVEAFVFEAFADRWVFSIHPCFVTQWPQYAPGSYHVGRLINDGKLASLTSISVLQSCGRTVGPFFVGLLAAKQKQQNSASSMTIFDDRGETDCCYVCSSYCFHISMVANGDLKTAVSL